MNNFAILPNQSKGREYPEEPSNYRSDFQRDRDRILHCGSFRKLQFKTQVFLESKGDYYRTRLTHTLEVAQIARTLSTVLGANSELAEAIALAHDLGHPPFGHTGEEQLQSLLLDDGGFDHNLQSLKIVTKLEEMYASHPGLNLTIETLDGIIKHNGPLTKKNDQIFKYIKDLKNFELTKSPSIEAQIAAISDDIAYNSHDLEDGLKSNLFYLDDLENIPILNKIVIKHKNKLKDYSIDLVIRQIVREIINEMVEDLITVSYTHLRAHETREDRVWRGVR